MHRAAPAVASASRAHAGQVLLISSVLFALAILLACRLQQCPNQPTCWPPPLTAKPSHSLLSPTTLPFCCRPLHRARCQGNGAGAVQPAGRAAVHGLRVLKGLQVGGGRGQRRAAGQGQKGEDWLEWVLFTGLLNAAVCNPIMFPGHMHNAPALLPRLLQSADSDVAWQQSYRTPCSLGDPATFHLPHTPLLFVFVFCRARTARWRSSWRALSLFQGRSQPRSSKWRRRWMPTGGRLVAVVGWPVGRLSHERESMVPVMHDCYEHDQPLPV